MSIIKGDNSAILVRKHWAWTRESGVNYEEQYSGPEAAILAKANDLANSGNFDEIDAARSGRTPRYDLLAKVGRDPAQPPGSDAVNTDELISNEVLQSVLLSPVLRDLIPAEVIASIVSNQSKVTSGDRTYTDGRTFIAAACVNAGIASVNALAVFDDLLQGRDSYYTTAYVYRRTITVSKLSTLRAAFTDTDLVLSTAQVIAAEATPNSFPLPDGNWLKKSPHVTSALRQKTLITYEYWWGDYNSLYYEYK